MDLCEQCRTIRIEDLPSFPDDNTASRSLSGLQYYHQATLHEPLESISQRHHPDLASLRTAAAARCSFCQIIAKEADNVLSDFRNMNSKSQSRYGEPKFDLWLTRLPIERPGFMVLTNCKGEHRKAMIAVAAVGFCNEQDDPALPTITGRPVSEVPDKDLLDRLVSWVHVCDGHAACVRQGRPSPARLIHVGSAEDGTLDIISTETQISERYVALSYCYKHSDVSRGCLLPQSQHCIEFFTLPKTFQDAVITTRALGVKYLWIDEICIAKEEVQDWSRSSANVADVFVNAYLTLAATGTSDTTEGLFHPRKARDYKRFDYQTMEGQVRTLQAFSLPLDKEFINKNYIAMQSEPLSINIWSFQDRVLASRTLHFSSDQVYLECQEALIAEDGLHLSHTGPLSCARYGNIPMSRDGAREGWREIMWAYGQRVAQTAAEKLSAMAGIARMYAHVFQDEYVAGLWKQSFLEGLTWQSLPKSRIVNSSVPSWSWASFGGIAVVGFREGRFWEPLAKVINYHIEPQSGTEYGAKLHEAAVEIEATLIPLAIVEKQSFSPHVFVRSLDTDTGRELYAGLDSIDRNYEASAAMLMDMKLFCLVLGTTHPTAESLDRCSLRGCSPATTCRGLIVTPTDNEESMVRIGFIMAPPKALGYSSSKRLTKITLK